MYARPARVVGLAAACALLGCGTEAPPQFVVEPQGRADAPTMDELLAGAEVLESGSASIGPEGGELVLPGGLRISVPAGALPSGAELSAYQHRFDGEPDGVWQDVYRFTSSAPPASPLRITFPIPGSREERSRSERTSSGSTRTRRPRCSTARSTPLPARSRSR